MCEVAEEAMVRVAACSGQSWVEVDIAGDPVLEDEYGLRVVVLLDGKEHGYWKVEEHPLMRDLARPVGGGR